MKNQTITVKVAGERKSVETFVARIEDIFPIVIKSKILLNDNDYGCHVFLNLNPNRDEKQ